MRDFYPYSDLKTFPSSFFSFSYLHLPLCIILFLVEYTTMALPIPLTTYPLISQVLHTPLPILSPSYSSSPSSSQTTPPYTLLQTATAGRSLFSTRSLEPSTNLMIENLPVARCLLKEYIKEVCWECWLERGQERKWSVRESDDYFTVDGYEIEEKLKGKGKGKDVGGIRWFCTVECRTIWRERVGRVGREVSRMGEVMIKEGKERKVSIPDEEELEDLEPERSLTLEEVEEAWQLALIAGQEIIRLRNDTQGGKRNEKLARKLVEGLKEFDDEDMVRFLLEGFISLYLELHPPITVPASESLQLSPATTPCWNSLCSLVPSLAMYLTIPTGNLSLASNIRMYHSFLLHLPLEILEVVTPYTILVILSRDLGNSFGTWEEFEGGAPPPSSSPSIDLTTTIIGRGQQVGFALYPPLSFYNHSCSPNVVKKRTGTIWNFSTIPRMVEKGEELCISYLGGEERVLSRDERRKKLQEGWGFECCCTRCESEM